jgi:hypothetical protein
MDALNKVRQSSELETTPAPSGKAIVPLSTEQWMVELAQNERAMLMEDTIHIKDDEQLKQERMRRETDRFMQVLRQKVTRLVQIFNESKGHESSNIKMFKIAGSSLDFMLFRNTLKLVFATPKTGTVDVYFSSYLETAKDDKNPFVSGERLELKMGPFDEPLWCLKGERIAMDNLIRKFVSDFVLLSCR